MYMKHEEMSAFLFVCFCLNVKHKNFHTKPVCSQRQMQTLLSYELYMYLQAYNQQIRQ